MKGDDCSRETSSNEQIFIARHQGSVNGGRTRVFGSGSSVFFSKKVNTYM